MISNEWTELKPPSGNGKGSSPVMLSMVVAKSPRPRCRINLSRDVVSSIGALGCRVKVSMGYGENAGSLRLIADGEGPFNLKPMTVKDSPDKRPNGRFTLLLPISDELVATRVPQVSARYRLEPVGAMKALIITLPSVLLAKAGEPQRRVQR
ncbi:hypothetical protein [Pleomorphomonas koreensis]|uniref:hypothetical protein n=1 Tax=Pleomorphomonas koreensis TaxID=257440 RepID=UPI00047932C4|nr:hypothetical protein [Pleomorphomonas koreensis]